MPGTIEILINGSRKTIPVECRVAELLRELDVPSDSLAVEINENILPRKEWPHRALQPGDRVEVVHFVGGG